MHRIVSILPKGEGFCAARFGAIALCLRDFTRHSRYADETLILGGKTPEGFPGIAYRRMPPARWYRNRTRHYARSCAAVLAQEKTGLAEIHNRPALLRLIARHAGCKLALHLHNDPQEMAGTRTPEERAALLARASAVYCVSGYIAGRFAEGLPEAARGKIHVVHNGLELPAAPGPKEQIILFAGRMTEGKGALLLAQALARVLPQLPGWRALLIGSRRHEEGNPPTPHEEEIMRTLAPLGKAVELAGFLSHAQTLGHFARATIAVVPSVWQEPFGRTALEAMAYGCALISSGRGGLAEVTGDAALTPDALTPEGLAASLLQLARDPALRETLSRKALARAREFTIERCAARLDEVRQAILLTERPSS